MLERLMLTMRSRRVPHGQGEPCPYTTCGANAGGDDVGEAEAGGGEEAP